MMKSPYDYSPKELALIFKKVLETWDELLFVSHNLLLRAGMSQYDALDGRRLSQAMQYMKRRGWVRYRKHYRKWQNCFLAESRMYGTQS